MSANVVICLAICALAAVSVNAGVVPLAAPLAAAGVVAPYATSYNAHTVNHAVAAPFVAAAPYVAAAPAAKLVAAPAAYGYAASPFGYAGFPAAAYTAYNGFPASYVI
ncbi:hypothetical protein quinque_004712 [Culex quinquefasciatus]|uniref:cuticle protein 38-like n=1 Tax=Culex quinquefasciatus TaxID=7176 RepID=UPI0018E2CF21|nr:cuticle protein 38-like [Culex quinquefasciatus]XP_039449271.1 cuticle protein 38-like [Culex pipiens pallens]